MTDSTLTLRRASDAIDAAISARIGVQVGHGVLTDGTATLTARASTSTYMLTCVSTGRAVGYRINGERYATPADIPATYRKARVIADAWQAAHDAGDTLRAVTAYVDADNAYRAASRARRAAESALDCASLFGTHSDDKAVVHHGGARPLNMCGKHARYMRPADYDTLRAAGVI